MELVKEARHILKRYKPDAIIGANASGMFGPIERPYRARPHDLLELLDYGCWESQPSLGRYDYHSYKARYTRNLSRPVQTMTVRFVQGWGDQTLKPVEQMKYELASIMANGGLPAGEIRSRLMAPWSLKHMTSTMKSSAS